MPIRVPDELPAVNFLREENVFVMTTSRASGQEIRPLKVLILNLMPKKIETENQFLRLLLGKTLFHLGGSLNKEAYAVNRC